MDFSNDEIIRAFGMSVSKDMVEFDGRVLEAPPIEYKVSIKQNQMCVNYAREAETLLYQ